MINLYSKGDHVWEKSFETQNDAYDFLWSLVGKMYGYFNAGKEEPEIYDLYIFDVEDDCIFWEENGDIKYCPGWHWSFSDEDQIIMPNYKTLYEMFDDVGN